MDLASQTKLRKRFAPYGSDVSDLFIIMLRQKKMYVNQDGLKNNDFESVRQWILTDWEKGEPKSVPNEPSFLDELLEKMQMYLVCSFAYVGATCALEAMNMDQH